MEKNYYSILNISEIATSKEIKIAYRKLAMEWHPDRNKSVNAHSKFIKINEAYEILIDPIKREEYDKILESDRSEIVSEQFSKWQNNAKNKAESYAEMNADKFNSIILEEIKLAAKYTPAFGCFILLIAGAALNFVGIFMIGPVALLSVVAFGGGAIYVYNTYVKVYSEERKKL